MLRLVLLQEKISAKFGRKMASNCNWRLEAISNAARGRKKTSFVLKAGENTVGKKKNSDIKIFSVLCSREHCIIFLDGDKVTLKDTSRNGTYITYTNETKHYTNMTTEHPLEQNDMISFGFNTASVYDVNDKNAYIYRLVKEQIETIDIGDSDDEVATPAVAVTKDKFIEITNKVIDIDSDSDSNYSGDECFKNIEEMEEEEEESSTSSSVMIEDDISDSENFSESDDSMESEREMVVTKVLTCGTPTETIALDEDDDDVPEVIEENDDEKPSQSEQSNGEVANGTVDEPSTSATSDNEEKSKEKDAETNEMNKPTIENDSQSEIKQKSEEDNTKENDQKPETTQKSSSEAEHEATPKPSSGTENEAEAGTSKSAQRALHLERLEKLRRSMTEKASKKAIFITEPQRLKKRRQTITEDEYNQRKQEKKLDFEKRNQLRKDKLKKMGEQEKAKREEAAKIAADTKRPPAPVVAKVTTVTRGEQFCTDLLAFDSSNT